MTRRCVLADRWRAVSSRDFLGDDGVQCAEEQGAGIGRARQRREYELMD